MKDIKHIIESLLFVTDDPLSVEKIKITLGIAEAGPVREALNVLVEEYKTRGGGFYLNQVAGGYQLRTRPEYREWIKRLVQPKAHRLSRAALETLAIVAYKQPIIRSDIEHIRGVDSGGILRALLERKLIRVMGRREIPGRPLIYGTTKLFLEVFGLKSLQDLPTPREIEEFEENPLEDKLPQPAGDQQPQPDQDGQNLLDRPEQSDHHERPEQSEQNAHAEGHEEIPVENPDQDPESASETKKKLDGEESPPI